VGKTEQLAKQSIEISMDSNWRWFAHLSIIMTLVVNRQFHQLSPKSSIVGEIAIFRQ
jgi:hypothetical protein